MQSRHVVTVLVSQDSWALSRFYREVFSWVAIHEVGDYVEMEMPGGARVAISGVDTFARKTGEPPGAVPLESLRPVELRLEVRDLAIAAERLSEAGARRLAATLPRPAGDTAEYWADPAGNVLALVGVKDLQPPKGHYTRDEFVRRVADVVRRSGVDDAETLIRDLENSVAFPMLSRCGQESQLYRTHCVLLPGHEGACQGSRGERWTRL